MHNYMYISDPICYKEKSTVSRKREMAGQSNNIALFPCGGETEQYRRYWYIKPLLLYD